ncbi:MAG: hypothetical protein HQK53_00430 [Oligoflexia bacterium]|nr:hypothetical protein [Oligoflexia bacterium]
MLNAKTKKPFSVFTVIFTLMLLLLAAVPANSSPPSLSSTSPRARIAPATPPVSQITLKVLMHGNPLSGETFLASVKNLKISDSKKILVRNDGHFSLTPAFLIDKDQRGDSALKPIIDFPTSFVCTDNRIVVPNSTQDAVLDYPLDDIRLAATNLAYWLGITVDKVVATGYLQNKKMDVNVFTHCAEMDNAYYSPNENIICLGHLFKKIGSTFLNAAPSSALDADVAVHEFGHAIFHHLSTFTRGTYFSFGNDSLSAVNEGQADFFTYNVLDSTKLAPWFTLVLQTYFQKFEPNKYEKVKDKDCLRELDNDYNLVTDYFGEAHKDGQIFGSLLYDLSQKLGKDRTTKLWVQTISNIKESDSYGDYVRKLLRANNLLFDGKDKQLIENILRGRGFISDNPIKDARIKITKKIIDQPLFMNVVLNTLGVGNPLRKIIMDNLNGDSILDPGECVSIEFKFNNLGDNAHDGVEVFIPTNKLPPGISIKGQTRFYLGSIPAAGSAPSDRNIDLKKLGRAWTLVCADSNYQGNIAGMADTVNNANNVNNTLELFLKSTGEGIKKLNVQL